MIIVTSFDFLSLKKSCCVNLAETRELGPMVVLVGLNRRNLLSENTNKNIEVITWVITRKTGWTKFGTKGQRFAGRILLFTEKTSSVTLCIDIHMAKIRSKVGLLTILNHKVKVGPII